MNNFISNPSFKNGALFGAAVTSVIALAIVSLWSKKRKHDNKCIYLDYNATTPVYDDVQDVIADVVHVFGNPSSPHVYGKIVKQVILDARTNIGKIINAPSPDTIIFTSCGTESDNRAIDLAMHVFNQINLTNTKLPQVITSSIEHPAINKYLIHLETQKAIQLHILKVNAEGFVSADDVEAVLNPQVALVTIMHSNNEVGTIQPIREIGLRIAQYNADNKCQILFHSDAAQSIGKVPVDVQYFYVDMVTLVGHKFGAPKGIAALYINPNILPFCHTHPMLIGGGQEQGIRSGTESTLLIAAMGEASALALRKMRKNIIHMLQMKLRLVSGLRAAFAAHPTVIRFNGPHRHSIVTEIEAEIALLGPLFASVHIDKPLTSLDLVEQLPNTVSVSFRDIKSSNIIAKLSNKVACSGGSSCHSNVHQVSDVLKAMGVPDKFALGTLRLSVGPHTTAREIDQAVSYIQQAILSELVI